MTSEHAHSLPDDSPEPQDAQDTKDSQDTSAGSTPQGRLDCTVVMEQVHAFLASELDEATCDAIRVHLMACEQCMDNVDAEQAIKQLVHRCCSSQRAPETLRVSIMSSITTWRRSE